MRALVISNLKSIEKKSNDPSYRELVDQLNVLVRTLEENQRRIDIWGNRINRNTYNFMFMGG